LDSYRLAKNKLHYKRKQHKVVNSHIQVRCEVRRCSSQKREEVKSEKKPKARRSQKREEAKRNRKRAETIFVHIKVRLQGNDM